MSSQKRLNLLIVLIMLTTNMVSTACIDLTGDCGNELLREVLSPDRKLKAVTFQRDCGATTGFTIQISVLSAGEKLPNEGGNVFVADTNHSEVPSEQGGVPIVDVRWVDESNLLVKHDSRARVFLSKQGHGKVRIRYEQFTV